MEQKFVPLSPNDYPGPHGEIIGKATCEICKMKGISILKDGPDNNQGKLAQHRLPTNILRLCDGSNTLATLA
ncbi:MAG: hypothetical protein AAB628_01475 [Patescibacteria group bacterium]